jgi:hypothetical protein
MSVLCIRLDLTELRMLIHHIKPEQFPQLEAMFGVETASGLEIPPWLLNLKDTAKTTPKRKDFEPKVRQVGSTSST